MRKYVDIHVTGIHSRPGEPTEKVVTSSSGVYEDMDDGRYKLEYDEEQGNGAASVKVHNKVFVASDGRGMEILRGGDTQNRLEFGENLEYDTEYKTPYGSMTMKVITKSFDFTKSRNDDEMKVIAEYELEMDGMVVSDSMIIIEIKKSETR
ncbi:DUF1934 domain-containing protein [Butyrivibrio sp. YAB3001]|uniref:DUF1934 domain-containing protein n=1 Tax=Butyrivibrio sp. YAB3001 TaxID=1520812 RepID=UPI0008F66BFA|nr:DUF1934 domain-containing protein [Butyrivibrio sp. YAB3001]SFC08827.1 Uncharacterized beta-barrel protein YwiB, DUF1934 family [Butyrivibrio sp. YAB3001]